MGTFAQRFWKPEFGGIDLSRRLRTGGPYSAYVPDDLAERMFLFDGRVASDVADAERAIARFDSSAAALTNAEALARLLLRAEAVASSHIEGLQISPQRLLRVSAELAEGGTSHDTTAIEVLANVDAMSYALTDPAGLITVDRICEVHRRLLVGSRSAAHAGVLRTEQNWIGGNAYSPLGAAFVPAPPEDVPRLLHDLCRFCNDDALPAIAQAAIAHAQFETIHPFADGNGRTGRALMYQVLRRRGLALRAIPPISLILATCSREYIALLDQTRYIGPPDSAEAIEAIHRWLEFFATACTRAVADAESFEQRVATIRRDWEHRIAGSRAHSTARILIERLPEMPIVSVTQLAERIGRTFPATNNAIAALVEVGILVPTAKTGRGRTYEAKEIIDAFTHLERRLASPTGNTRTSRPVRNVPGRPRK